jgi:CRISPR-associated protein Cmr4
METADRQLDLGASMKPDLSFYRCLSPLHHGAGEGLGFLDRPLLRDSWTGEPFLLSSSLRGEARRYANHNDQDFGPQRDDPSPHKDGTHGLLGWSDARLLFLPVRSRFGTVAYLTSTCAVARLAQYAGWADAKSLEDTASAVAQAARNLDGTPCAFGCFGALNAGGPSVWLDDGLRIPLTTPPSYLLEDLGRVNAREDQKVAGGLLFTLACAIVQLLFDDEADRADWIRRVLWASEAVFEEALKAATAAEPASAVDAATGAAKDGSLRWTEFLPEGAVLTGLVFDESPSGSNSVRGQLRNRTFALGAHTSSGKGLVAVRAYREVKRC